MIQCFSEVRFWEAKQSSASVNICCLSLEWDEHPEPLEATCEKRQEENSGEGKKRKSERRLRCEDKGGLTGPVSSFGSSPGWTSQNFHTVRMDFSLAYLLHVILLKEILLFPFYPDGCFCYSTVLCQIEGCRRKRKRKGNKKPVKPHHLLHCLLLLLLGQPLFCAGYVQRYVSHVCFPWILTTPIAVLLFYRWDLVTCRRSH